MCALVHRSDSSAKSRSSRSSTIRISCRSSTRADADGSLFCVRPYEDELPSLWRISRDGPLPIEDAVLILRDVCDGLAFAHERGIVHRDIKPDNVLLSGRHAMITDFGVAEAAVDVAAAASSQRTFLRHSGLHGAGADRTARPSIIEPTSIPSACWRTSCSRASGHSTRPRPAMCCRRISPSGRRRSRRTGQTYRRHWPRW